MIRDYASVMAIWRRWKALISAQPRHTDDPRRTVVRSASDRRCITHAGAGEKLAPKLDIRLVAGTADSPETQRAGADAEAAGAIAESDAIDALQAEQLRLHAHLLQVQGNNGGGKQLRDWAKLPASDRLQPKAGSSGGATSDEPGRMPAGQGVIIDTLKNWDQELIELFGQFPEWETPCTDNLLKNIQRAETGCRNTPTMPTCCWVLGLCHAQELGQGAELSRSQHCRAARVLCASELAECWNSMAATIRPARISKPASAGAARTAISRAAAPPDKSNPPAARSGIVGFSPACKAIGMRFAGQRLYWFRCCLTN